MYQESRRLCRLNQPNVNRRTDYKINISTSHIEYKFKTVVSGGIRNTDDNKTTCASHETVMRKFMLKYIGYMIQTWMATLHININAKIIRRTDYKVDILTSRVVYKLIKKCIRQY